MGAVLTLGSAGSAVTSVLESAQTELTGAITAGLPIAGGVFALIAGIFMAIKIFKRVTGARS